MQFGGQIWTAQAGSCWTFPLAGKFLLLISLLTWLFTSTYMQSLELSIKESTKLRQVKTCRGDYLKCSIPDSLSYLLSGCLTHFQNWIPMFPMASSIIMDSSLHVSSALYASWPRKFIWPQPHSLDRNFTKEKISESDRSCFCGLYWLGQ